MLFKYSNNSITCFSLVIALIVLLLSSILIVTEAKQEVVYEEADYQAYAVMPSENSIEDKTWSLKIPKLNIEANIEEGTNEEVLENYIGHFLETSKLEGNIGLAAHNRGYKNNFFQSIKELENGDELIYCYCGNIRIYSVIEKQIISNTDWTYLENTEDNMLTLITCVEDMPDYRLCLQAIQK